ASVLFLFCFIFFFIITSLTVIFPLSLHDALPISFCSGVLHLEVQVWVLKQAGTSVEEVPLSNLPPAAPCVHARLLAACEIPPARSEEHTSELQSRFDLVCRLLLEKKK